MQEQNEENLVDGGKKKITIRGVEVEVSNIRITEERKSEVFEGILLRGIWQEFTSRSSEKLLGLEKFLWCMQWAAVEFSFPAVLRVWPCGLIRKSKTFPWRGLCSWLLGICFPRLGRGLPSLWMADTQMCAVTQQQKGRQGIGAASPWVEAAGVKWGEDGLSLILSVTFVATT